MTVNSNLDIFLNKKVDNYSPEIGIKNNEKVVYRIGITYEEFDEDITIEQKIDAFAKDPNAFAVKELIIGAFDFESSDSTEAIVKKLVELKDTFKNLTAIFIGDITFEESEISWIKQSDVSPVLKAYPNLQHFQVRGAEGLSLGNLQHDNLKTLIIETGGMPPNIIDAVSNSRLPKLEKLELWFGSENYGFESTIEDLATIISGKPFPLLKSLGLMDSEIQDEIAIAVAKSPVLKQLETLDLSMGILSDKGAVALLESEDIRKLKFLNLKHHYMSTDMMEKLKTLMIDINMDDQEEADDDGDRYIEVSE